ncbi:MAG: methionyl-tRNA formyltransferase [Bacteroidota bacterium]
MHPASHILHPASRIIFYGTPEIAKESLKAVVDCGYQVVAVVTAPDRPAGRGMKMRASKVKEYALEQGLKVLQPEKLSDPVFFEELRKFKPDLQVVVAFRMMPRSIWTLPPKGTFNLHASLLPQYRGAAPINWAVINGEAETGLTTFFLRDKVDTGDIIFREPMSIGPDETAGELHDRMKIQGAQLVIKTIEAVFSGKINPQDQSRFANHDSPLKPAPKIYTDTCRIDWNMPSAYIYNKIRGLSPLPGAFTEITLKDGSKSVLKIFRAGIELQKTSEEPGSVLTDGRSSLRISAPDGYVNIYELQIAGRKPMKTDEFLRGFGKNIV